MSAPKWTARAVVDSLRVAYGVAGSELVTDEWAFLTEVPLRVPDTRYARSTHAENRWTANQRTIDVMLVRSWTSGVGHRRIAVEVKVSKSDYRNETDVKRAPAEAAAHQTYYAAPAGLIDPKSLPAGWGLLEVHADRRSYAAARGWTVGETGVLALVKCRVRAYEREPWCNLDYLTSAYARRASRAEERIRRGADDAALVPSLRADVERLTGQLDRRDSALDRERGRARQMQAIALAVHGGHVCADCEAPIGLDARRLSWKHRDATHEVACETARAETNRLQREDTYGARYMRGWADPVEPKALREQAEGLPERSL